VAVLPVESLWCGDEDVCKTAGDRYLGTCARHRDDGATVGYQEVPSIANTTLPLNKIVSLLITCCTAPKQSPLYAASPAYDLTVGTRVH
jgi:hypothetical protein